MLIALLCESDMKLADETIEMILDKVSGVTHNFNKFIAVTFFMLPSAALLSSP